MELDELENKDDVLIERKCTGQYGRVIEDEDTQALSVGWWGADEEDEYEPL